MIIKILDSFNNLLDIYQGEKEKDSGLPFVVLTSYLEGERKGKIIFNTEVTACGLSKNNIIKLLREQADEIDKENC